MSWNPFKKEAKEPQAPLPAAAQPGAPASRRVDSGGQERPPSGDPAGAVPPEAQDATDPLLELGAELLAETAVLVRAAGPVTLERVTLAGGGAAFLRLRVLEPGALADALARLLLELPEAATGFHDMLVDGTAALAAKLADAPLHLAQARRLQHLLDAVADTAALLAEIERRSGLAWASPSAAGVLLKPAPDDALCLRTLTVQFAGWDGLAEARGDEAARLALLGAEVCRSNANMITASPAPALAAEFHRTQAEALARWFTTLSQRPGLSYTALAEACASLPSRLARTWATDPGLKRPHNEDACLALELDQASSGGARFLLAAVADGMGGHASGEVASHLALSLLRQHVLGQLLAPRQGGPDPAELAGYLSAVIPAIDTALIERANLDEALSGMGTTLCGYAQLTAQSTLAEVEAGFAAPEGDTSLAARSSGTGASPAAAQAGCLRHQAGTGALFNVGDSRAYLLTAQGALRLSHDHSLVQGLVDSGAITAAEAFTHPQKNVITRCLGGSSSAGGEPDVLEFRAGPGDSLLLCSDGLSDMLDDGALSTAVGEAGLGDLDALAAELIRRANEAGGNDNITVVLLRWEL